jgi:aminoglycoside 6'-N-acetyltransferase I
LRVIERDRVRIERCTGGMIAEWASLRQSLWPEATVQEHLSEAAILVEDPRHAVALLARTAEGTAVGFAEATLRHDYVNGCTTSPVVFLEGIYVHPSHRRCGIARLLCEAVEDWGAGLGCTEFASDAELDNAGSQRMHAALGFDETERVVYFRKRLEPRR